METDIELCSVTDVKTKEKLMNALVIAGVPYAERWEKVPLIKRKKYNGAREICIVITHKGKVELARTVIDGMDKELKKNIVW